MSVFEWSLKAGFVVTKNPILAASNCTYIRTCICAHPFYGDGFVVVDSLLVYYSHCRILVLFFVLLSVILCLF